MSDQVIIAGIGAAVTITTTIVTLIVTLRTRGDVHEVRRQTNGMRAILEKDARAAGFEAGRGAVRRGDAEPTWPEGGEP